MDNDFGVVSRVMAEEEGLLRKGTAEEEDG
jgi:hypothetical protein